MAAGFASALLDELMGRNRDNDPADRIEAHWSDPNVCKFFLCGFCPNDLFTNTRAYLGRCSQLHHEDFRTSYQKSTRCEKMGYERDFTKFLENLMSDIDRKISRGRQRLVINSMPNPGPISPQITARLKRIEFLTNRISELVAEAEILGCDGNVDQAQSVMVRCEKMRAERTTLTAVNDEEMGEAELDPTKAMEVCAMCGALLILADLRLRPNDHIQGKQHLGYARIRAYIEGRRKMFGNGSSNETNRSDSTSTASPDESGNLKLDDGENLNGSSPAVISDVRPEHREREESSHRSDGRGDREQKASRDQRGGSDRRSSRRRSGSRELCNSDSPETLDRKRRRNERQGIGHVGHERGTDVRRGTNEGSAKNDNCFVEDKKHRKRRNKGGCREDDVDDDSYVSNRPNDQK